VAFGQLSLKGRALRYLSQREHSRAELQRKLAPFAKRAVSQVEDDAHAGALQALNDMLDELAHLGLLSDERTAASLLLHQNHRLGPRRLRQQLVSKGLAPELVSDTVAQALADELPRAHQLWQRRFGRLAVLGVDSARRSPAAERARQMRFLLGRGFSADVANRVVREGGLRLADDVIDEQAAEDGRP